MHLLSCKGAGPWVFTWTGYPSLLRCGAACRGGAREGTVQLSCPSLAHFLTNSSMRLGVSSTAATPAVVPSQLWVSILPSATPHPRGPLSHLGFSEPAPPAQFTAGSYRFFWLTFSLIPWLSKFHAVWFSGASGCLLIAFRLVVIFLLVVWGSEGFLPMPPSSPEPPHFYFSNFKWRLAG